MHRLLPGGVFTAAGAGVKTNLLFFTRGKPTEKIWYYDLSDRKVGKKTPLTLDDFKEFFELLPKRADSVNSWTMDFTARRRKATEEARAFRQMPNRNGQEDRRRHAESCTCGAKESSADRRSQDHRDRRSADAATLAGRDAAKKAEAIESAVYDLKAVNPNRKADVDKRTPTELLDLIETKGKEVAEAVKLLRTLT